jgi:hypothetical protein
MAAIALAVLLMLPTTLLAGISLPESDNIEPIVISGQAANRWQEGPYEVWLLRGNCALAQGRDGATCREAVFWIEHAPPGSHQRSKVIAHLEGNVDAHLVVEHEPVAIHDSQWLGRFATIFDVRVSTGVVAGKPDPLPEIYQRGMNARNPEFADSLRQTRTDQVQFAAATELAAPGPASEGALPPAVIPQGTRRVRIYARSDVPMQGQWQQNPQTHEAVAVLSQGVNMIIEGLTPPKGSVAGLGGGPLTLDLSADRMVVWTVDSQQPDVNTPLSQDQGRPLEVYMEGNIVFRQGERQIHANYMYYDVRNQVGKILGADMITSAPGYEGKVRLRADVLQQTGPDRFVAQNAWFTTSQLGIPGYSLRSSDATFESHPILDPVTGAQQIDPLTNKPLRQDLLSAQNNFLYLEEVPIFYWPTFATDLDNPTYYIRSLEIKEDGVFGTQVWTDWSGYQLFGIKTPPKGTDWILSLDYLSKRGLAEGTTYTYDRGDFLGISGPVKGSFNFWGISDHGTDNLGLDRSSVLPEPDVAYRYKVIEQHRQELADGLTFTAELGKISDRNFLQEYFKPQWDQDKDPTTDLELKFRREDISMSLMAEARLDNFVTETQWLPRFDHYLLGQSEGWLTWFEHTSLGYAQFKTATLPSAAAGDEPVSHLPWEQANFSGGRFVSRDEVDLPLELGPVKIAPYLLGELGYWGEDLQGQPLTQAYYQAGIRATLPMWAVDSDVESALWNVHGLAHKVEFQAEYLHAQSTQSFTQFPLYDPLDDHQIEDFRRRFVVNTFDETPALPPPGYRGPPTKFDERYYAFRSDMEGWVTAPSMEIAGDLDEVRLGLHQRWQTKRGPADCQHITDWIELDTDVTLFPDASRDNYGTAIGLTDYNFIWHVGDRLTVLSDGMFDFFGEGQKIITTGVFLTRPPRGALYLGFRILEGPISSEVLAMSYSYWMSPKWITAGGMSIDLKQPQNFGPTFQLVRVGESLLIGLNVNYNPALNTAGASLVFEPRFVPKSGSVSKLPGIHVGQAGELGVE